MPAEGVFLPGTYSDISSFYGGTVLPSKGLTGYESITDPQLARDGIIQRFEFTCDLAWKTTREWLLAKLI